MSPRVVGRLLATVAVLAQLGCAASVEFVHPHIEEFAARTVAVEPIVNETVYTLDAVAFGGPLQRLVVGAQKYDIPSVLLGALEEALLLRGYDPRSPDRSDSGSAGMLDGDADMVARCAIVFWEAETSGSPSMDLRFRLDLSTPQGERLYGGTFAARYRQSGRSRTHKDPTAAIRSAMAAALRELPSAP